MWPAITGANRTNPRPVLPTSQWSLLSAEGNNRMLKLITSAYRTNWFLPNGARPTVRELANVQPPHAECCLVSRHEHHGRDALRRGHRRRRSGGG